MPMWPFRRKQTLGSQQGIKNPESSVTLPNFKELSEITYPWIDRHLALYQKLDATYVAKGAATWPRAVSICNELIRIAPAAYADFERENQDRKRLMGSSYFDRRPKTHPGFYRLAIIRERQGDHGSVIALCREAMAQGWNGDWEKRIERCEHKRMKQRRPSAKA